MSEWHCDHKTFEELCRCIRCGETFYNNSENSAIPKYLDRIAELKTELTDLRAKYEKAVSALRFYSTEFSIENNGAWIGGPLYKDRLHGNDMFNCGSYSAGGKLARQTLAELGEK